MYTGVRRMCGTKQSIRPTEDTRTEVSVVNARDRLAPETNTTRDLVGRGQWSALGKKANMTFATMRQKVWSPGQRRWQNEMNQSLQAERISQDRR